MDGFEARAGQVPAVRLLRRHLHRTRRRDRRQRQAGRLRLHRSANSQNRAIQEITFGFNQTIWANPRYGAINLMGQYEYLTRNPWYVAPNSPDANSRQHHLLRRPLHAAGQHAEVLAHLIETGGGASRPHQREDGGFMKKQILWITLLASRRFDRGVGGNHQRGGRHVPRAHLSKVVRGVS